MSATRINFTFWRKIFTIYFTAGTANKHTVKKVQLVYKSKMAKKFCFHQSKEHEKD